MATDFYHRASNPGLTKPEGKTLRQSPQLMTFGGHVAHLAYRVHKTIIVQSSHITTHRGVYRVGLPVTKR